MLENEHRQWMLKALELAQKASDLGEVPVGAVIVRGGVIIGEGFNQPVSRHDATAHAEIVALRDAGNNSGNYRLPGSTIYVSIEPCTMCVGALIHARIGTVVFGAREPKAGALISNLQLTEQAHFNHKVEIKEGILAEECSNLLIEFFIHKRGKMASN